MAHLLKMGCYDDHVQPWLFHTFPGTVYSFLPRGSRAQLGMWHTQSYSIPNLQLFTMNMRVLQY